MTKTVLLLALCLAVPGCVDSVPSECAEEENDTALALCLEQLEYEFTDTAEDLPPEIAIPSPALPIPEALTDAEVSQ